MSFRRLPAQVTDQVRVLHPTHTGLSGRWLLVLRVAWIVLVVCILGIFVASLPASFATLHQPYTGAGHADAPGRWTASGLQTLAKLGISLDAYAWFWITFNSATALVWLLVGNILFWRKSNDWMALLVSLMLVSVSITFVTDVLLFSSSSWRLAEDGLYLFKSVLLLLTLALFPNGRFVPRWAGWIVLIYPLYAILYLLFLRPLHIAGWSLFATPFNGIAWFGSSITLTLAQLYRYVRVSNAGERQQTKWVAFGFLVSLLLGDFGVTAAANLLSLQHLGWWYVIIVNSFSLITLLLPLSIGIAMLRYRLWDIDVLINKALVYGLLTALLLGTYLLLVFGGQYLLSSLLGPNNPVVLVVSTLLVAALFQPLRKRIQAIIDRRFYRRQYDAEKTLTAFSTILRNEVDLASLSDHLLMVVQETMQPAHLSLWLLRQGPKPVKQMEEEPLSHSP